jgi:hypothetical protein
MSFTEITAQLSSTFRDQASIQADTFAGKMARINVAFTEAKETVGSFVLDAITPMITSFVDNVIPTLVALSDTIGEKLKPVFETLSVFLTDILVPAFKIWWGYITDIVIPSILAVVVPAFDGLKKGLGFISTAISDNSEQLKPFFALLKGVAAFARDVLAPVFGTVLKAAFEVIGIAIAGLITGFAKVVSGVTAVVNAIKGLISLVANNPLVQGVSNLIGNVFGGGRAAGGSVTSGTPYLVGETGAELFVPQSSGMIVPNNALGGGGTTINLTVNGAIDSEGTARQIIAILNNSYYRGTQGAGALVS